MSRGTVNWETEFWHYVSTGDGVICPVFQHCQIRLKTGICQCPLYSFTIDRQVPKTLCFPCFRSKDGGEPCNAVNPGFLEQLRPGRIFELLALLSESWLKIGGVSSPPVPDDLINIMDRSCDIEIRTVPMKSYGGAIWKMKDSWVIYLNANDNIGRQRISLFHEAFHILAHCKATPIFRQPGSDKGEFNELLANNFALHILMPKKWFEERWAKCQDPAVLAEQFQVTEKAARRRVLSLNLI